MWRWISDLLGWGSDVLKKVLINVLSAGAIILIVYLVIKSLL